MSHLQGCPTMLPPDPYKPEDTWNFMEQFSDINIYGVLLIGDFKHPLSKMVSERFDALHILTGNKILLLVFDPPGNFSDLFKNYWEEKLNGKFDDIWAKWQSGIKPEAAYLYGGLFNPEVDPSQFPCLVLFTDLEKLENQQVVVVPLPNWNSDDLFKLFKNYIIRSMIKSCRIPEDKRLAYLQRTLNSRMARIGIHFNHLEDNCIEYIKKHPTQIVVATAGFMSALASGNVLPLGVTAIAFLDTIRGKK